MPHEVARGVKRALDLLEIPLRDYVIADRRRTPEFASLTDLFTRKLDEPRELCDGDSA
jgi:hypothetical protein